MNVQTVAKYAALLQSGHQTHKTLIDKILPADEAALADELIPVLFSLINEVPVAVQFVEKEINGCSCFGKKK